MPRLFNPLIALQGSFKGHAFKIANERGEGGRRGPHHQYPDRDRPFFEDLGADARRREFSVYFVGPLADLQARRFEAMLWKGGPGPLVLPGYQRETALAQKWDYRKSSGRANWVEFAIVFIDPGGNTFPAASTSWPHRLFAAALDARTAFADALGDALSVAGLGQEVAEELIGSAGTLGLVLDIAATLASGRAPSTALTAAGLLTSGYVSDLGPAIDTALLATATFSLIAGWSNALAGPSPDRTSRARTIDALFAVYEEGASDRWYAEAALTPTERVSIENQRAFSAAVRRGTLVEVSRHAASLDFASYDDAARLRARLADAFDEEINVAGDPILRGGFDAGARSALQDLRATALEAISSAGANKARLVPYAVARPRPALALAQLFYGTDPDVTARAAELVARTGAVHPAFLPAKGERLSR